MARKIKYRLDKEGRATTKCPNGFTTFVGNRPKRVGMDCMFCKYREHIDFDEKTVLCNYKKKKN